MGTLFMLCNCSAGYRKKQLKLTKFVFRVLFQLSSSRTAALLQTMSSLPHKDIILEKASLIKIIIIIIIITTIIIIIIIKNNNANY